jgi:uncharacterized protein (PEP-CTERM system associated)
MEIIKNKLCLNGKTRWLCVAVPGLLFSGVSVAENWQIKPQLTVRELYSDNQRLATPDFEEGGFITEVSPALSIYNTSRRLPIRLDYQFQNVFFPDLNDYEDIHLLNLTTKAEAVREQGFIDFGLNYSPRNVDANGRNPRDNLNLIRDRARVLNYHISPYWLQPIGNRAIAEFHYGFDDLISDNANLIQDSHRHEGLFKLRNGSHYSDRLLWDLDFDEQRIDQTNIPEVRLRYYLAHTQYQFVPHWGFITELGYDDNDVGASGGPSLSGVRWGVGFHWEPLKHTSLELVGGERYFGESFRAAVTHLGSHFRFNLGYAETPTTFRDIILQQQLFTVTDPFTGLPVINPATGQPVNLLQNVPTAVSDILVSRALTVALGYRGRHNDFLVQFQNTDRDYQRVGNTENTRLVSGTWTHNFSPRTKSTLVLEWYTQDLLGGRKDQDYFVDFLIGRKLTPTFELSLGARHFFRDSNIAIDEYSENRVMAMIVKTWR